MLKIFLVTTASLFGILLTVFVLISDNFASIAVESGLNGMADDLSNGIYIDQEGSFNIDDTQATLIWGMDALYSNLGYRLVDSETGSVVYRSVGIEKKGAIIDSLPTQLPNGYSHLGEDIDVLRKVVLIGGDSYFLDVSRSDRIGRLANEAVVPALVDLSIFGVTIIAIVFFTVAILAVRIILSAVAGLSNRVSDIQPDDLKSRLTLDDIPYEFEPVINAFNVALARVDNVFEQQKQFLSNAAHELRTPLSIQMSRIEFASMDADLKKNLLKDTLYMSRTVEQLLDLSRIQSEVIEDCDWLDLVTLAKEVISRLAPIASDRQQEISFISALESEFVLADKGEIAMVLKNLLENAIRHSPEGSAIVVSVGESYFSVEDSGFGIPIETREKIFERFWRSNQSDVLGSGLGLSIVSEVATRINAEIYVDHSESMGGAMFVFKFSKDN